MTVFLSIPDTCPTSFQTLDFLHPVYQFFVEYSAVFAITFTGQQTHTTTGAACEQAVAKAIHTGYRLIDTAEAYDNEEQVGRGNETACNTGQKTPMIGNPEAPELVEFSLTW